MTLGTLGLISTGWLADSSWLSFSATCHKGAAQVEAVSSMWASSAPGSKVCRPDARSGVHWNFHTGVAEDGFVIDRWVEMMDFFCFLDVIAVIVTTIQWLQEPLGQWDRYVLQKDILLQGHTALRKCLWVWHMATGYPRDEAAAELVRMSPTDVCSWPSVADVGEQKCPWRWKLLELLLSLSWIRFWWWKWRGFWLVWVLWYFLGHHWASSFKAPNMGRWEQRNQIAFQSPGLVSR